MTASSWVPPTHHLRSLHLPVLAAATMRLRTPGQELAARARAPDVHGGRGPALRAAPPRALFDRFFGRKAEEPAAEAPASPRSPEEDAVARSLRPLLDGTVLEGEPLSLAFDACRDGWTAAAFHQAVDNRGPTLLVARSAGGSRFGGFNPLGFASREDYRDTSNAFLFRWAAGDEWSAEPEYLQKVGAPAIFDFGAQGPCFGADALKIPLSLAPSMGSSFAGVGGSLDLGPRNAAGNRSARSRLGSHFARRGDGGRTLFTDEEGMDAQLTDLRVYVSPGREGYYL